MARATARHILITNKAVCEDIIEEINNGSDFAQAAEEYSECPSGAKGGDLGTFSRGQMVKEFDEVVFSAEIGKIYGPVKTNFGYHIIQVTQLLD